MSTRAPTLDFISSGDDAAYRVRWYGHEWDDRRVQICHKAPSLYYPNGKKRLNYTEKDYDRFVIKTLHYMRGMAGDVIPWEIIKAYNDHALAGEIAARTKYPDVDLGPITLCLGRCYWKEHEFVTEDVPDEYKTDVPDEWKPLLE